MGITANGYETTSKENILQEVQNEFKSALGQDLVLDPETPQGNLIQMLTDMLYQIDRHRQNDFYARDIYRAAGLQLDIIGRELALPRKPAVPTQIQVSITGIVGYTVPEGTTATLITDNTMQFYFPSDIKLSESPQQVTLIASNNATYTNLLSGQQLHTQEYIPQIYDITIVSVVYGQAAESDYQYRLRLIDAQSAGVDEVKHLQLALQNIDNVLSAYVDSNNTLETSPTGVPSHAIEVVVLGGADADIANVLMSHLFATPTYKDPDLGVVVSGVDFNGHTQNFNVTRPQQKTVTVSITYTNKEGQTLSTADIAAITNKITQLINSTYMNKTLYSSDICAVAMDGYSQVYAIKSTTVNVDGAPLDSSYTCTSREYLYAGTVELVEDVL